MDMQKALMTRLVVLLDLLYDGSKDQTGIWCMISDVIEEMVLLCAESQKAIDELLIQEAGVHH